MDSTEFCNAWKWKISNKKNSFLYFYEKKIQDKMYGNTKKK